MSRPSGARGAAGARRPAAALLLLALAGGPPAVGGGPELAEILARYHAAIGGLEAWRSWSSVRTHGTMSGGGRPAVPYTMTFTNGPRRASRLDFTLEGRTGIMAWDGESGWTVSPFLGGEPAPLEAEQARAWAEQSDFAGPLVDSEEKGIGLELAGLAGVEGEAAYEIAVTMPSGLVRSFYLDAQTFLPLRVESTATMQGVELQIVTRFTDFRAVHGMVLPHVFESRPKGGPEGQRVTIDSVELDVELPPGYFSMPAGSDGGG